MKAPKCKVCEKEHWGVCYTPPAAVAEKIARVPAKKSPKKTKGKAKK